MRCRTGHTCRMGTDAWRNWRIFNDGVPELENFDDELQSDAEFMGGPVRFGPYELSTVIRTPAVFGAAVIVTGGIHAALAPEVVVNGELAKADSSAYHGGRMTDEIAALVSLELGVRLRFAGTRRISGIHQIVGADSPIYLDVPRLVQPGRAHRELLPSVVRRHADLGALVRLESFPAISEEDQVELVRAARSYASALWWANEDPNMAWLQLVTAVEAAATRRQTREVDPIELVTEFWPDLWGVLKSADAVIQKQVAERVRGQMRATRKFLDFVVECAPPPPEPRTAFPIDWAKMRDYAKIVYGHRSKALHEGKPFPLPMLEPPRVEEPSGAFGEAPLGLNSGGLGGVWDAKETPMLLSTFEHIARGALLVWWDELAAAADPEQ